MSLAAGHNNGHRLPDLFDMMPLIRWQLLAIKKLQTSCSFQINDKPRFFGRGLCFLDSDLF